MLQKQQKKQQFEEFAYYEKNEENFQISKAFDLQRKVNPILDYKTFFEIEKAKLPKPEFTENDSRYLKDVKACWEQIKDTGNYKQVFLTGVNAKNNEFIIVDSKNFHLFQSKSVRLLRGEPHILINGDDRFVHDYILRDIMKIKPTHDNQTCDHINRVHWDESEKNLRWATFTQQNANQGLTISNTS
jgi:hypothetical protein